MCRLFFPDGFDRSLATDLHAPGDVTLTEGYFVGSACRRIDWFEAGATLPGCPSKRETCHYRRVGVLAPRLV